MELELCTICSVFYGGHRFPSSLHHQSLPPSFYPSIKSFTRFASPFLSIAKPT